MALNKKIDAVVLAGDKTASRFVCNQNKMHLEIEGTPLLFFVLKALEDVELVDKICIVGPKTPLEELIQKHSHLLKNNKPLSILEQKENMYRNFWAGFVHTIPGYYEGIEKENREAMEKLVLILPCDLPLATSSEIRNFLDACPVDDLDYCLGMTEEKHLEKFYPDESQPGVSMAYLFLREGNFRVNNLHLVRPFKVYNREYIEKIYECRYQKKPINMMRMVLDFILQHGLGLKTIFIYGVLELSLLFRHLGWKGVEKMTKSLVPQSAIRFIASKMLKTRIDIVPTTMGGCAIDVDNETDYETIRLRFREWKKMLENKQLS